MRRLKMAKKKPAGEKKISSIEKTIEEKFGDVIVSGKYIVEKKRIIVPVSPVIDDMLGGGIPFGSFVIPTGPPKVGKTSMALDMAATALSIPNTFPNERHLYFFNIEGRINPRDLAGIRHMRQWLDEDKVHSIGSKPGKILTAENYLEIGEQLINEKPGCVFIFDSFSQLCSQAGRDKEWDDGKAFRDDVPKFLAQFCKRISNVIPINDSIVVGITHRIANTGFGFSPWAEASGTKIQYAVDVKMQATHDVSWMDGESKIGQIVNWECSCSPLHNGTSETKCASYFRYGYGIDKEMEIIDVAVDLGIIKKGGTWFTANEGTDKEFKAQGKGKFRQGLIDNPDLFQDINRQYREMMEYDS